MAARRNPDAAVLREGDPGAENALRVVPARAQMRMVGTATLGYIKGKSRRSSFTSAQRQAQHRIAAVARVLGWRAAAGEVPDERGLAAALDVLADAARFFPSGQLALANLKNHLPSDWCAMATDVMVFRAQNAERDPRGGIMSNREAGRNLTVRLVEILALEAEDGGKLFLLLGTDESDAERALRRAARERQMDRELKRRKRAEAKSAESCNPCVRKSYTRRGDPDRAATFQAETVRAAVEGGAAGLPDIVAATGLSLSTTKPLITRLVKQGSIVRAARGRYAAQRGAGGLTPAVPATSAPTPEPGVSAGLDAAAAPNSGPEVLTFPPEPPSEVESNVPALPIEECDGRALQPRGPAGLRPAPPGPEVEPVRPASAAAPVPGCGTNVSAPWTEGATPPHPRARLRKAVAADAQVIAFPAQVALRRVQEAFRTSAPVHPSVVAFYIRGEAIRASIASSTRSVA